MGMSCIKHTATHAPSGVRGVILYRGFVGTGAASSALHIQNEIMSIVVNVVLAATPGACVMCHATYCSA